MVMNFVIKRQDKQDFRNFIVKIGDKFLIDRNEDFYAELNEWVDGVLTLMKTGRCYFSTSTGFSPFFGSLDNDSVEFETIDGHQFSADFMEVVSSTIIFMYEQSKDIHLFDSDAERFREKADQLLSGFRFRFKKIYKGFVDYLYKRGLSRENSPSGRI